MARRYDRLPFERVIQSSSPVGGKGGEAKRIGRSVGRSIDRLVGRLCLLLAFYRSVHVFWSSLGRAVFLGTSSGASGTLHSGSSCFGAGRPPRRFFEDWAVPPEPYWDLHWCRLGLASAVYSSARAVLRGRAVREAQLGRTRERWASRPCALYLEVDLISTVVFQAAEQSTQLLSDDGDLVCSSRCCAGCRGPVDSRALWYPTLQGRF